MCIELLRYFESCRRQDGSKVQHNRRYLLRCSTPYGFHDSPGVYNNYSCLENPPDLLREWYQQECPECSGDSHQPRVNRFKKVWVFGNKEDAEAKYALSLLRIISIALEGDPVYASAVPKDEAEVTDLMLRTAEYAIPEMICRDIPQHGFHNPHLEHSETDAWCDCVTEAYLSHINPAASMRRILVSDMIQLLSARYDGDENVNDEFDDRVAGEVKQQLETAKKMLPFRLETNGELTTPITNIQPYTHDNLVERFAHLDQVLEQFVGSIADRVGVRNWYDADRYQHHRDVLDVGKAILAADRGISVVFARHVFQKLLWILPPGNNHFPNLTFDDGPSQLEAPDVAIARRIHFQVCAFQESASQQMKDTGLLNKFLDGNTANHLWVSDV